MAKTEIERFIDMWQREAKGTEKLLAALPKDKYDFRPDPKGRSLGELAWHLSEIDAYISRAAANGKVDFETKIPGLERPKQVAELAPGYRRVHEEAVAIVRKMKPEDVDKMTPFMGSTLRNGDILMGV